MMFEEHILVKREDGIEPSEEYTDLSAPVLLAESPVP
jgi:hypothetical protein